MNIHFRDCGGKTYNETLDKLVADGTVSLRGLKEDAKVYDEMILDVFSKCVTHYDTFVPSGRKAVMWALRGEGASPPPSADSSPAFGAIALPFSGIYASVSWYNIRCSL